MLDWHGSAVACLTDVAPPIPEVMSGRPAWQEVQGAFKLEGQFTQPGVVAALGFDNIKNAVGSGLAGDAATGAGHYNFALPSKRYLSVQVLTGPDAAGQTLKLAGGSNMTIDLGPLTSQLKSGWQYILLPGSEGATSISLSDDGTGWGQWSAIGDILTADVLPDGEQLLYTLPVHFDGNAKSRWKASLTHQDCQKLARGAVLDKVWNR